MRILVVEDSRTQAEALGALLEEQDYGVVIAATGEEALVRVRDGDFDLVISDIVMPGISGYHVCHAIKTELNRADLPVMLLTALTDPMDIVRGLEAGADNFFRKPYDPPRLLDRIRQLLESREVRRGEDLANQLKVSFLGRTFTITAEKEQILDLLIATFEDAVLQNRKLREREEELEAARKALAQYAGRLEERLERIADTVPDVLYSASPDRSAIHYVSPACASVLGFTQEELLAEPERWSGAIQREHRDAADAAYTRILERGEQVSLEYAMENRDRSIRWIEETIVPVLNPGGMLVRIDGIARDVTTRKEAELALTEQKEFLRQVIDTDPNLIFVRDRDGNFILASQAVADLYGTTIKELVAAGNPDLPPGYEDLSLFLYDDEVAISRERKLLQEEPVVDPSTGRTRWFQTIKVPLLLPDDDDVKMLGVATDVTERRQMEEKVRLSQKLEAVGRLAGGVAHDFNNVLTAIRGFADLIRERAVDEQMAEEIDEIRMASDRATALARQLLAFSRRQVVQPRVLELSELVEKMKGMLTRLVREDMPLTVKTADRPVRVLADPTQIEQVVLNLVVNARDAMPDGGAITIEIGEASGGASLQDSQAGKREAGGEGCRCAFLRITDRGVGIPEEALPHIFDLFFTTKEVGGGSGFGLSTVQGILQQLDGTVTVDSEPGCTSFTVFLPEAEAVAEAAVAAGPPVHEVAIGESGPESDEGLAVELRATGALGTIVLAEDDAAIRKVIIRILEKSGYVVHSADTGEKVLDLLASDASADLLITDLVLPDVIGWKLAERAVGIRPDMRVLYMSGYARDDIDGTVMSPSSAFLPKPFMPSELADKVRAIFEGVEPANLHVS